MKRKAIDKVETASEARSLAIEWQGWASDRAMSYGELSEWGTYFVKLANKFNLTDEFRENGVI